MDPRHITRDKQNHPHNFPSAFQSQQNTQILAPSLPDELERDQNLTSTYETNNPPPPLSTTHFLAIENMNSSPHLLRPSMHVLPADAHLFDQLSIPLTLAVQPFSHKQEVPEGSVPVYCRDCLCYVNMFTKMNLAERYFECNVCESRNVYEGGDIVLLPSADYSLEENKRDNRSENNNENKDNNDNRNNRNNRNDGNNTFIHEQYFERREFLYPVFVFAVQRGPSMLKSLREIKRTVENDNFKELFKRVSLFLFDSNVYLYKVNERVKILTESAKDENCNNLKKYYNKDNNEKINIRDNDNLSKNLNKIENDNLNKNINKRENDNMIKDIKYSQNLNQNLNKRQNDNLKEDLKYNQDLHQNLNKNINKRENGNLKEDIKYNQDLNINASQNKYQNLNKRENVNSKENINYSQDLNNLKNSNYRPLSFIEENVFSEETPFVHSSFFVSCEEALEILEYVILREERNSKFPLPDLQLALKTCLSLTGYAIGSKTAFFTECIKENINLDYFIEEFNTHNSAFYAFTPSVSCLERICTETNGCFYAQAGDLRHLVTKSCFGVRVAVKTSDAIRRAVLYANTSLDNTIEAHFSQMDSRSVITYGFYLDETMKEGQKVYVQVIVRYYSCFGEQRLLVLNHSLTAAYKLSLIYNSLCFDSIFASFVKLISSDVENTKKNINTAKQSIIKCLKYYRKNVSKTASSTQMVLPENIKLLPLLISALMKNRIYNTEVASTEHRKLVGLSVERTTRYFYPRIFSLSDYFLEERIILINNTADKILPSEIYIIENGFKVIVYIGRDVETDEISFMDTEEGRIVENIVAGFSDHYDVEMGVEVLRQGVNDAEVLGMLVEDRLYNVAGYSEFLCEMHFSIREY